MFFILVKERKTGGCPRFSLRLWTTCVSPGGVLLYFQFFPVLHSLQRARGHSAGGRDSVHPRYCKGPRAHGTENEITRPWTPYLLVPRRCQCRDKTAAILPVLPTGVTSAWAGTR